MANRWVGAAAGLVGGQVAGRALAVFLKTRAGERLLSKIDRSRLTPLEHRVLVQRWSGTIGKAMSAAAAALVLARSGDGMPLAAMRRDQMSKQIDWVQVMIRAAEVMLAAGAIFKVVGEFLEDRQKTATETQRHAARRLA
jgi:hypothetical protein